MSMFPQRQDSVSSSHSRASAPVSRQHHSPPDPSVHGVHKHSPFDARPSLSPTTPAAHTLASLSRGQPYYQHPHPHPHPHPHSHQQQHNPHPHPQHNPYPPLPPGAASGTSSRERSETGRPTSAVLAALASSDLEYPGIMPPREVDGKPLQPRPYDAWERDRDLGYGPPPPPPPPPPPQQQKRDSLPPVAAKAEDLPPKKRRRKGGAGNTDIPDDAEVEYADPDGDTTRGPVFVHPPKGAVQACVRCHRIKRKCDGAFPRCASCTRADVPCVFELSAATSTYVHTLKDTNASLTSEVEAANARIRALEEQIARSGAPVPAPLPPTSVGDLVGASNSGEFARMAVSALSMREHAALGMEGRRAPSRVRSLSPPAEPITELLTHEGAHKAAKMYFDFNALSYPLLDKAETLATIDEMYGAEPQQPRPPKRRTTSSSTNSDASEDAERRQFLAGMVLAIGSHNSARAGENDAQGALAEKIYRSALRNRARALERENMLCVQALCLLALWTMSNPAAGSIWQLVGLAARVITAIGLHRRAEPNVNPHAAECRRRLFYAFYNIDRILAPTLCKPLAISEEDIDIELPTQRPEDGTFRGHPLMNLTRHVVRYRGLMGRILTELYSVNGANNHKPEPERIGIVHRLHAELDAWIVDCPPPMDTQGQNTPKANYSSWWQIHYNHGLCTLYRPSPLYPDTTPETLRALYDASSRCVDLYLDMYAVNKTSFHLLQIIALFVSCISLLCCLCECDARMRAAETSPETAATLAELGLGRYTGADDPAWAAEIRGRVSQCQSLFDAFGHHLPASAKYRDTFFRISELLLARYGPLEKADAGAQGNGHEHGPGAADPPAYAPVMDVTPTGLVPQVAPGEKAPPMPGADDMAGAWDAMTQLWFDLGDMFGDESDPFATIDNWAGEWGGTLVGDGVPGHDEIGWNRLR
ncbi:hypothetical protein CC85DRAFT_331568 [Cutaneotrichosporon oleaginosum]|uniref:Zn(2)-C6 fungal-type domain-containing protein n=1 Tax=Cutaneotrichosporon oleaginosum TaxID=879819 RepID=A0A0J1AT59_9TREE|nr:uncharacterized protein CC85DRAFT_331568 [Cutaneotrichosporon oleaginosum]KLT38499.1 hypothetical protein CC85DRAFT_331568 [Cutaneotrichosporon oleaginosum]TXT12565.1 hypothetical protein COLE_02975 [Cutaneotrichosporon oleaginosum]